MLLLHQRLTVLLELTLCEYESRSYELSPEALQDLLEYQENMGLTISPRSDGRYAVRASQSVGVLQTPTLRLQIQPKIPVDHLFFLLMYTGQLNSDKKFNLSHLPASFAETAHFYEVLVQYFFQTVSDLFQAGLLQGYRSQQETLNTLRGRIDFARQVRENYGRMPPLHCEYQLFSEDIPENQLLLAALECLRHNPLRESRLRIQLANLLRHLGGVSMVSRPLLLLEKIHITRLNQRYLPALKLAELMLRHSSFSEHQGAVQAFSFRVDMNKAFEDFVTVALRESLELSPQVFPQNAQGKNLYLDQQRKLRLEPDLSWWESGQCCFIGDVKYKKHKDSGKVPPADIYQMLAYLEATQLDRGILIYAHTDHLDAFSVDSQAQYQLPGGKTVDILTLDLRAEPHMILQQIETLARRIRSQKDLA